MSGADILFEQLGYEKTEDCDYIITYMGLRAYNDNKDDIFIVFNKNQETITKYLRDRERIVMFAKSINLDELKAINMKCKELGWSDE